MRIIHSEYKEMHSLIETKMQLKGSESYERVVVAVILVAACSRTNSEHKVESDQDV